MRTGLLVGIALLAVAALAVGWRVAQTRRSPQADNLRAVRETSAPQAKPPQQSAEQPAVQAAGTSTAAAEEKETERRLGPFSISGSDYLPSCCTKRTVSQVHPGNRRHGCSHGNSRLCGGHPI